MSASLVAFEWEVPVEGHRWHCWHHPAHAPGDCPDPQLVERADPLLADRRRYAPFESAPSLYREFARVAPTPEGVIAFADRWGPLFGWEGFGDTTHPAARQAEILSSWRLAISQMKCAVELWDVLRDGTREARLDFLQSHLVLRRDAAGAESLYYDTAPDRPPGEKEAGDGYLRVTMLISPDRHFDEGGPAPRRELSRPARVFLCGLVNRALRGQVSPRLFPDAEAPVKGLVPVMASMRLVPTSLHGGLWLQFAYATSSDKAQKLCPGCGEWFQLEKGRRSDREYCTEACRKTVNRRRVKLARRLHAEGKKVKDIADELGVEPAQVKKWVIDKKG